MFFLNPAYLWASLGLAVPIAIHLWSKKEGKTIKVGSIQLLSEADSKQNSSIKLNELLLLLIRLLLIALVVLIMAEPQIKKNIQNTKLTYLVEPSLLKNKTITDLLEIKSTEASFRLLKKGFPEFELDDDISNSNEIVPHYWQLAQEMEVIHSDSIIVFSNGFLKGLKGKRPEINANVEWIIFDEGETSEDIIRAVKKDDNIELLSLVSNSQNLSFKKDVIPLNSNSIQWNITKDSLKINDEWQIVEATIPLKVLIFNDDKFNKEATYINSAFKTISKYINQPIEIKIVERDTTGLNASRYDYVVWLSDKKPKEVSGKLLTFYPDKYASSLVVEKPKSNVFYLTKTLNSESIIDQHLAEQLIHTLDFNTGLNDAILQKDKRIVAKEELQPIYNELKTQKSQASVINISKWLWLLLASLLILERIVANYRKQ
ncbi:hypothetical protein FBALC1_02922 [Flavobacteriales bacterium ALC-1]|nr:hypothetical protein FBALC1_02922 [Flavobacteriales bacterium ALC-1]